jgi:hypothetical protein
MRKQYIVCELEKNYTEEPNGYYTTTKTTHKIVEYAYGNRFDSLEEAEADIESRLEYSKNIYTILTTYSKD